MEWGEASAFARGGITTTSAPAPQSPLQTTTALRRTCTHGRGHETYLVAGNALVDEVVCELALDSARQASIFAAFVCHDLLQPHLEPVRGHSGSAVRHGPRTRSLIAISCPLDVPFSDIFVFSMRTPSGNARR